MKKRSSAASISQIAQRLAQPLAGVCLLLLLAAAAQAAPFVFVSNQADNTLSMIDIESGLVVGLPIPAGMRPSALAITPDGNFIYAINETSPPTVSVIDTSTRAVVNTIFGITTPNTIEITRDGRFAYVTNRTNQLFIIDTNLRRVVGNPIALDCSSSSLAFTPDGQFAYSTCGTGRGARAMLLRLADNTLLGSLMMGDRPDKIIISRDGTRAYVAHQTSNQVYVIDIPTRTVLLPPLDVQFGTAGPIDLALNPAGTVLYVLRTSGAGTTAVAQFNIATDSIIGTPLNVGRSPNTMALTPDGARLYVINEVDGTVTEINTGTFTVTRTIRVGRSPADLVISPITSQLATVSAASFSRAGFAPEAIVAAFGNNLAMETQAATSLPLPGVMGGSTIRVKDSTGTERVAPLFFVSPSQSNFLIPAGTAAGQATITVSRNDGFVAQEQVSIAAVSPGLFTANASGQGVAAAVAFRLRANGTQEFEPVARFDTTLNRFVPLPINLGPEGDQVFLVLYGTGFRARSSLAAVTVNLGGLGAETTFAGAVPGLVGLDQLNVRLARSLLGRGEVDIVTTVDGRAANTVRVSIQ
jgi:uncharacterized protein (TIGR03437 family)